MFADPEAAVQALIAPVGSNRVDELSRLFGPDAKELIDTADPAAARHNREVFAVAARERWRLVDRAADVKQLVVGNEDWPFPVPLKRDPTGWRWDTAAGKEEILTRRIGRNELSAIAACHAYVVAQRLYARGGHDGKPAGLYAATLRSDPGRQNGLYWPAKRGEKRSPLGDLLAEAADAPALPADGSPERPPFHGYYFRVLTAQGADAPGGARDYRVKGELSGGHALVAWPARYDVTGVMTFLVGTDGVVREKDLGPETASAAGRMTQYNPDASWTVAQ